MLPFSSPVMFGGRKRKLFCVRLCLLCVRLRPPCVRHEEDGKPRHNWDYGCWRTKADEADDNFAIFFFFFFHHLPHYFFFARLR